MAPTRSKKRKSTESTSSVDTQNFPAAPILVPTKTRSPARTPTNRSPIRKAKMGITLGQKQALIDNLQLEITERARKLRAQYMLQAQGLRTRIEIRINRIPMALRRANMGELLLKYSENASKPTTLGPSIIRTLPEKSDSPPKNHLHIGHSASSHSLLPQRGTKRPSDEACSTDKENESIDNPKKRPRGAPEPPERNASRPKPQPSQILSPTSANSRTAPSSPARVVMPPGKSYLARPVSPNKSAAPTQGGAAAAAGVPTNVVQKAKSTRAAAARQVTASSGSSSSSTAGVVRGKKTVPPRVPPKTGKARASIISESSDASTKTTLIRKAAPAKKEPVKKTVMGTIKGMGGTTTKKLPAARPAGPAGGTRVLRKRN